MTKEFEGRTALITGGAQNLGSAIALGFARRGANVVINTHRNREAAEAVAEEARSHGGGAMVAVGDIADPEFDAGMVADAEAEFGGVDYLINNAAIRKLQPLLSITPADWDRTLAINLSSAFYLSRAVLPRMIEHGFGRIINIGGPDGLTGHPNRAHNVAAKAGLVGLTKAISVEYGREGVTANLVTPGMMDTTRNPVDYPDWPPSQEQLEGELDIPRLGEPIEVADACIFFALESSAYITGQEVHVNGGRVKP
jgi:3-oxoacyl-[acyl-carrier protein] reductase